MPLLRSSDSSGRFSTKIVKLISTFDSTDWLLGVMNSMLLEALHVYLLKYGPRRANTVREEHLVQKVCIACQGKNSLEFQHINMPGFEIVHYNLVPSKCSTT